MIYFLEAYAYKKSETKVELDLSNYAKSLI